MALLGTVIFLSAVLGGSSFLFGLLPLTISFSRTRVARLSIFGTGLLLGAALGVIIPEGIETIYDHTTKENVLNSTSHQGSHSEAPTFTIAMSTLLGFIFMLVAEQISSQTLPPSVQATTTPAHRHSPRSTPRIPPLRRSSTGYSPSRPLSPTTVTSITDGDIDLDLDVELNNFNNFNDRDAGWQTSTPTSTRREVAGRDPRLLTFGLVVHSIADGLALGASLVTSPEEEKSSGGILGSTLGLTSLPLLVFFALALHKAPASLALTSTLMTQLSSRVVRTHLAIFSLAAPISAIITYTALTWFVGVFDGTHGGWTGKALLFSGGTFLYVATQLSPISAHAHPGEGTAADDAKLSPWARLATIASGMMAPALLVGIVGHGH